jgi:hypothetical protein
VLTECPKLYLCNKTRRDNSSHNLSQSGRLAWLRYWDYDNFRILSQMNQWLSQMLDRLSYDRCALGLRWICTVYGHSDQRLIFLAWELSSGQFLMRDSLKCIARLCFHSLAPSVRSCTSVSTHVRLCVLLKRQHESAWKINQIYFTTFCTEC